MENRYNLIDEPWIPTIGGERVSLRQVFSDTTIKGLSGNPVEKIALFKLLLAVAQSAYTPKDENDWFSLGVEGLSKACNQYLHEKYDCFWLYGDKPFLQVPEIKKARKQSFGAVKMEIAVGNTTVVTQIQKEKKLDDCEKAVLLVTLMGFALGGKKTDNSIVLSHGYTLKSNDKGKPSTGKPGPSLGFMGFSHSFFLCNTLLYSVYINLLSLNQITLLNMFPCGIGYAPWEEMPCGEADSIAKTLTQSYIGRLIPINRFCLLAEDGLHYSEGISHPNYESFVVDPSVTVDFSAKSKPKVIWISPDKKPWRQLPAFLSFLSESKQNTFVCLQLKEVYSRLEKCESFSLWTGGVKVSSDFGEQYLTGTDDFVESEVEFPSDLLRSGHSFYFNLTSFFDYIESIAKELYVSICVYYEHQNSDGSEIASNASTDLWQLCEAEFQTVVYACNDSSGEKLKALYPKFNSFAYQIFDEYCPKNTARQLEAWAASRPRFYNGKKEGK